MAAGSSQQRWSSVGLVNSFRAGSSGAGKARVVIDVAKPVVVESAKLEKAKNGKGPRLALEIVPVDAAAKAARPREEEAAQGGAPFALGAVGLAARRCRCLPCVRTSKPPRLSSPSSSSIRVMAATTPAPRKNGTVEKDVVLAFSKALKEKLEKSGRYKVMMTRDSGRVRRTRRAGRLC